jgi:hypothetical protein
MKKFHSHSLRSIAQFEHCLLLVLFISLFVSRLDAQVVENGGFESVASNGLPASWHIGYNGEPDHEEGGDVQVSLSNDAHTGEHSIRLRSEISSYPVFLDQDLLPSGNGPLPLRGAISFWYKILRGTIGRPAVTVLPVRSKSRAYPGGFFMPVTFAGDGEWHYAELGYDLTAYKESKSAFVRIYVMSFESPFPAPTTFLVDDVKFVPQRATYFAPRLLQVIEGADADECEVRLYIRNMSLDSAIARFGLELPSHLRSVQPAEQTLDIAPGEANGLHGRDSTGSGSLSWKVRGTRKPGDWIAVKWLNAEAPKQWEWKQELQPHIRVRPVFSRGLLAPEESASLQIALRNDGHAPLPAGARADFAFQNLTAESSSESLPEIPAGKTFTFSVNLRGLEQGHSEADITLRSAALPASVSASAEAWVDNGASTLDSVSDTLTVRSGHLLLSLGKRRPDYGSFVLYYDQGSRLQRLGSAPFLARVIARTVKDEAPMLVRYSQTSREAGRGLRLFSRWSDADGVEWRSRLELVPGKPGQILVSSEIEAGRERQLLAFQAPPLLAGDGGMGTEKDSAHLPGIEWVSAEETSSAHSHIPGLQDQRVPHPNKITVPLMAVISSGKMLAVEWDPLQKWDGIHDRPSLMFDSPNRTYGEANHLMGLFLPSIPEWVDQYAFQARRPYPLIPGTPLRLAFSILARDHSTDVTPVSTWYQLHGAPSVPPLDRTYEEERRSVLANSEKPQRIVECPNCGIQKPAGQAENVEAHILTAIKNAEAAMKRQGSDGWWKWSYDGTLINNTLNWTHAENFDEFGLPGEEAIGGYSTAFSEKYQNIDLFRAARYTGNPAFVEASLRALKRAQQFRRPEGGQPWELPLHTADILGAAYGVWTFVEGYRLTGDAKWLEQAEYWGASGLPFIYVWNANDQPHMRYGGIAVYGGSFMDYTLLGQPITWCAMDYAQSLVDLSRVDSKGPWRTVAQGILNNVILQHEKSGPNAGQWPDWRDIIKNRVVANVWYTDATPIVRLLLAWQGESMEPETKVVQGPRGQVRLTTDGAIEKVFQSNGMFHVEIRSHGGIDSVLAVAGLGTLSKEMVRGSNAHQVKSVSNDERSGVSFIRFDGTLPGTTRIEIRL